MRYKWIVFILSILAGLSVYAFFQVYERVEETLDLGFTKEARRNPWLAAEMYLSRTGTKVNSTTQLSVMDDLPENSALLLTRPGLIRSNTRLNRLLDWVVQGGRLIVTTDERDIGGNENLLATLGVDVVWVDAQYPKFLKCRDVLGSIDSVSEDIVPAEELEAYLEQQSETGTKSFSEAIRRPRHCMDSKHLTILHFQGQESEFSVHMPGRSGLEWGLERAVTNADEDALQSLESIEPFYAAGDDAGIRFLQFEWGAGLISIVANSELWQSSRIGLFDNVYLLATLSDSTPAITVLRGSAMPSLFSHIWSLGKEFVIVAMFGLLFWLWHSIRRISPLHDPLHTERRSILEHIDARGEYLWYHKQFDALVSPLKQEVTRKCQMRLPGFAQADPASQVRQISEFSGTDEKLVYQVFAAESIPDAEHCRSAIRILQKIIEKL